MFGETIDFIRSIFGDKASVGLHEPCFSGNEKKYLNECIDSTFVSSVGKFVDRFEELVADYVGAEYGVATVNGTAALHIALKLADVGPGTEVITQPLTFVATCNAIAYCGAEPIFVDVDTESLGMSAESLRRFLELNTYRENGYCFNRRSRKRIAAVLPMHTFGHPCRIVEIAALCHEYGIVLVEDAAESLGSRFQGTHMGLFGKIGVFSFNGNKTITTGGGGMIVTNDRELAVAAKHMTTTAKVPHPYEYHHDAIGYNYRMPNINAALGCAQMERLEVLLDAKRELAHRYAAFFQDSPIRFIHEPSGAHSNYWLNAVLTADREERDCFLRVTNDAGIMTRPVWQLMNRLPMFSTAHCESLDNAVRLEERLVNIPSGVKL